MPYRYEWVEPELFLEHGGVTVYYTYKEDDYEQPSDHWFSVDEANCDLDGGDLGTMFDIRELADFTDPGYKSWDQRQEYLRNWMRQAIDAGLLTTEGLNRGEATDDAVGGTGV